MTARHIGEALRKARTLRGMTLEQLSSLSGVHKNTICRIENGHGMHVATCIALASVLEFSFSRIVREAENMSPVTTHCAK